MRRTLVLFTLLLLATSSLLFQLQVGNSTNHSSIELSGKHTLRAFGRDRSSYPVWSIGDRFNYTQTLYDESLYSSYSYWASYEVMNLTTVTTPQGTYNVYGVAGRSQSSWIGIFPVSDGYYYYNSTNYYRSSDKAAVETSATSIGPNYHLNYYSYYKPPNDQMDYPILPEESWNASQSYYYRNSGLVGGNPHYSDGDHSYNSSYTCISGDTVTVPAGNFSIMKLRTQSDPNSYSLQYFDDAMGWYAKMESYVNGELKTVYELSSTTFVHGPSVNRESFDFTMREDGVDSDSIDLQEIFSGDGNLSYTVETTELMNVTMDDNGLVTFRPQKNWYGNTTVSFSASNGVKAAAKDIRVTVTPVNDPPYFNDLPDVTFGEGGTDSSLDLDDYAHDVDDSNVDLTYHLEPTEHVQANILPGDILELSSPANWYGVEYVGIKIKDGTKYSDLEKIRVIVTKINDDPVLLTLSDKTVFQYDYLNLTLSATDLDPLDVLTFHTNISMTIKDISSGVDFSLDEITGDFFFHPSRENLIGTYEIAFWVDDGMARDYSNITITVENVNDPPVPEDIFFYSIVDADPEKPGENNLTVLFTAPQVSDPDRDSIKFSWDFGDNTGTVDGRYANHTYEKGGNYTVLLSITDGNIVDPITQTMIIHVTLPGASGVVDNDYEDDGNEDDDAAGDDDDQLDDDDGTGDDDSDDDSGQTDTGKDDGGSGEGGTESKSGVSGWLMGTIVVVITIAVIVTLFVVFSRMGRDDTDNYEETADVGGHIQSYKCRKCSSPLLFIDKHGMWWCGGCEEYVHEERDDLNRMNNNGSQSRFSDITYHAPKSGNIPISVAFEQSQSVSDNYSGNVNRAIPIISLAPLCNRCGQISKFYPEHNCYWCDGCRDYVMDNYS